MPTDAARKQAHWEWHQLTDEESGSDDERWCDLKPDEFRALLAQQEAILDRFERDFLRVGPMRPDAEERGTSILRCIGKELKHNNINVAALLVNRPLFDLVMRLWDTETNFLIRLFPGESKEMIDTRRLSETIALNTLAQLAVSSPHCVYRQRLVLMSASDSPWNTESASGSHHTATSRGPSE